MISSNTSGTFNLINKLTTGVNTANVIYTAYKEKQPTQYWRNEVTGFSKLYRIAVHSARHLVLLDRPGDIDATEIGEITDPKTSLMLLFFP